MSGRLVSSSYYYDRDHLVENYLPLVQRIVGKLAMYCNWLLERDDMYSLGVIGLIHAIEKYDPRKGVPFEAYAARRIRGAILDELRKLSWRPRSLLDNMRRIVCIQDNLCSEGKEWDFGDVARELGVSEQQVTNVVAQFNAGVVLSFDDVMFSEDQDGPSRHEIVPDGGALDPQNALLQKEREDLLARGISALDSRDQLLLSLYYEEELTLREIGKLLGISEGRVCQLHARALAKLRCYLEEAN